MSRLNPSQRSLDALGICLVLSKGKWGNTGKGDIDRVETPADKNMCRISKSLLDSPQYEDICADDRQTDKLVKRRSVPSLFKEGIYRLRRDETITDEIDALLQERSRRRAEKVEAFIAVYESQKAEAEVRLADQFDPRQYPSPEVVRRKFYMRWHFVDFSTPQQGLSQAQQQSESQKLAESTVNAFNELMAMLRGELADMVSHLRERLTPGADGKAKTFKHGSLDNILEFCESLRYRNITDDADLEREVATLREVLGNVQAPDLRTNDALRETVRAQLEQAETRLGEMVRNVPRRRIERLEPATIAVAAAETETETEDDSEMASPAQAAEWLAGRTHGFPSLTPEPEQQSTPTAPAIFDTF